MDTSQVSYEVHPIFTKDPSELIKYVYKEVRVDCSDGTCYEGWVYTIDPVSESIVLASFDSSNIEIDIVLHHAIEKIVITKDDDECHRDLLDQLFLLNGNDNFIDLTQDNSAQRDKVMDWLLKHRLPVEISKDDSSILSLSDVLYIKPPYTKDCCISTNEIVLDRVQNLLKQMW